MRRFDPLVARYLVNGVAATLVHFGVFTFNMEVLGMRSAGAANLVAAVAGITASFFGSRYYVFRRKDAPLLTQASRFVALYGAIALLHGLVLFLWTDVMGLDYRAGFVIAIGMQVVLSFLGNKYLVFGA